MTQAALSQFTQRVRNIYGDAQDCEQIAHEILNYCSSFCDNTRRKVLEEQTAADYQRWSEEDIILITYGNSLQKDGEKPFSTLAAFLREKLKDVLNTVHILQRRHKYYAHVV